MINNKSFTLIELLVVIVIIGILAGVIIISTSSSIDKANIAKIKVFEESVQNNLAANMVSRWSLDEITGTAAPYKTPDAWGSNHGTLNGTDGLPQLRPASECVTDSCFKFDGVDDYVDCGNNSLLDLMNMNEFSLSIWVKTPGTYLLSKGGSGINGSYLIYYSGNSFVFKGGASTDTVLNIKAYNNWQYIALTYNRAVNLLNSYNDGSLTKEITKDYAKGINNSSLRFGTGDGAYFNGLIDDVRIYNAALSSSQIKQNYIAGLNSMLANGNISKQEYNERINALAYDK